MAKKILRDSNFELCRLVCMFYIVSYHLIFHVPVISSETIWGRPLTVILHIGVLAFVMISGYYGIKPKLRSFLHIAFSVAFYNVMGIIIAMLFLGHQININDVLSVVLPFTKGQYWFVTSYIILYILAPYVNIILSNLKHKEYCFYLLVLGIIVWYGGGILGERNGSGKGFLAFLLMYSIGRYIRDYSLIKLVRAPKNCMNNLTMLLGRNRVFWYVVLYFAISCMVFIMIAFLPRFLSNATYYLFYGYNEIGLYAMAVLFFMIFKSISFSSNFINWLSSSTFGVYLIHENFYIGQEILYPFYDVVFQKTYSLNISLIVHLAFSGSVFFACIFLDKCRSLIFDCVENM